MALPITLEIPPRDARRELLTRLEQAPAEHAEALLEAYALLEEMHDAQIFTTLRGVLSARDKVMGDAVEAAQTTEGIYGLRNAILLGKMMGTINPELMHAFVTAVSDTLGSERKPVIEPPGLLSLLGQFRRKELRRSVALINRFLESLGEQLKKKGGAGPLPG